MFVIASAVLLAGAIQKAPCANRGWIEQGIGVHPLCDSDIPHLLLWEQLGSGRFPYVDACAPAQRSCDEYPPITMYALRGIAAVALGPEDPYTRFYWTATAVLLMCTLFTVWCLERMHARTVLFAAAPVLFMVGTTSVDLLPVALTTAATLAFLWRRDLLAGALLGLGTLAKLYPGVLLIPFGVQRLREDGKDGPVPIAAATLVTAVVGNAPFAVAAMTSWLAFFRFNGSRSPDYDTFWYLATQLGIHLSVQMINLISILVVALLTTLVWRRVKVRAPETPAWIMGFPLLALLLLASKVWSPQYGIWLLPWFAMTRIPILPYLEYQLAEVAEYLVRFHFFGTLISGHGIPYAVLAAIVLIRGALLIRCLLLWMRDPAPVAYGLGSAVPETWAPSRS
jgi:hypothetical protein